MIAIFRLIHTQTLSQLPTYSYGESRRIFLIRSHKPILYRHLGTGSGTCERANRNFFYGFAIFMELPVKQLLAILLLLNYHKPFQADVFKTSWLVAGRSCAALIFAIQIAIGANRQWWRIRSFLA